jgi:hypothetical protein
MGMKCWKCKKEMGSLSIPMEDEYSPETLGQFMVARSILPYCISCMNTNPRYTSYENLPR